MRKSWIVSLPWPLCSFMLCCPFFPYECSSLFLVAVERVKEKKKKNGSKVDPSLFRDSEEGGVCFATPDDLRDETRHANNKPSPFPMFR